MTDRIVYRTQKGVLYRACRGENGYFVCFRPPCPAVWLPCVGMGQFPSRHAANEALEALASEQGWIAIGTTVPDPTRHWKDTFNNKN